MNHDELIASLTDPDSDLRDSALDEVFVEMDDDLARAIVGIAGGDYPDEIRADAIVALGPLLEECGIDYDGGLAFAPDIGPAVSEETFREVERRLRAIYEDAKQPKLVRRRAFEVLVRDPQPWQEDEIRKHLGSADEEWRLTAIFGMGSMPGFEQDVLDAVNKREGVELAEAVRAAAKMEVRKAAPRIRKLAESDDTERELRIESILALPHVDVEAFDVLDELQHSDDSEIAEAAKEALEELMLLDEADEDIGGDGD